MKLTFVEVVGPSVAVDYSDRYHPIHTSSQSQSEIITDQVNARYRPIISMKLPLKHLSAWIH